MRRAIWPQAWLWFGWALLCLSCGQRASEAERVPAPIRAASSKATPQPALPSAELHGAADRGRELVQRFECSRCHEGTGFASAPLSKNCFSCHEQILSGRFPVSAQALARFRPHVASAREAPSLMAIAERLQGAWVRDYLLGPFDLRPKLTPTMPRLALDYVQASDIAAYLTESAAPEPPLAVPAGNASRGRELMDQKGCASCHAFSGVPPFTSAEELPADSTTARAAALAPDLRFTRLRFRQDQLPRWLLDPRSLKPDTRMPNFELTPGDASDIAAYILGAPLAIPSQAPFVRLPVLTRRVPFEEVNRVVFSRTCHHCHTDAESAGGDGGPGNTGGFGFAPRGVSFSSHASIMAGYTDTQGQRRSLFEPLADGSPRLVAALLARHAELNGSARQRQGEQGVRGMPLALPPLSAEAIQLVETWVAQGKPL